MKNVKIIIVLLPLLAMVSCCEEKIILKGNKIYRYMNNQGTSKRDQVIEYTVQNDFKGKINDKNENYKISDVDELNLKPTDTADIDGNNTGSFLNMENIYYTSESKAFKGGKKFESDNFRFRYGKFALTGMTIPLKFRGGVGNDTINPPTVETGFNVNFAPAYRLNWSSYNPSKKILGNTLTNYSLTFGGLLGVGSTDLKVKSNAPGLLSDRKSSTLTYGGMVLFGLNSIGIGYAFGFDNVMGEGGKYWVYQNKIWHGITVSVDLIK